MDAVLRGAFAWDCEECGAENFIRAIEGNIDEAALMADENQVVGSLAAIPDSDDGPPLSEFIQQLIMLAPRQAVCAKCQRTFPTKLDIFTEE